MQNLFARYSRPAPVSDRRNFARGMSYQGFNQARPRVGAWYELPFIPSAASALACVVILASWSLSGGTKGTIPRAPLETKRPSEANAPSLIKERPVIAPEIGSAQPYLAMRTVTDPQRKLLYVNLWGEVGTQDGQRFRTLVTPYVQAGYLLYRVTISSLGGSVEAAMILASRSAPCAARCAPRFAASEANPIASSSKQRRIKCAPAAMAWPTLMGLPAAAPARVLSSGPAASGAMAMSSACICSPSWMMPRRGGRPVSSIVKPREACASSTDSWPRWGCLHRSARTFGQRRRT